MRAVLSTWLLLLSLPALAGGVRSAPPLSIPRCASPIQVDGNLREWGSSPPALAYVPLRLGENLTAEIAAALQQFSRRLGQRVEVRACYDEQALYLALLWVDPMLPATGGGGLEIHLQTDQITHVQCWPGYAPQGGQLKIVSDSGPALADPRAAGAWLAAQAPPDRRGYNQEIRLPWKLLTRTGQPATAAFTLFFDFVWSGLGPDFLRRLPVELLRANTHFTFNYLTAPDSADLRNYLPDPKRWGTLVFDGGGATDQEIETPLTRGATRLAVRRLAEPVTIDGDLADWKPVGLHAAAFAPRLLGSRYAAALGVAYDEQALYLAVSWLSAFPLFNQNPVALGQGFNGGDCLQFRVLPGTGKPAYYCAWYDTAGQRPALTLETQDFADLLARGAEEAFRTEANGYTQEIKIPWTLLTPNGQPPAKGDEWPATFQLWWAGLDSRFTVATEATLEQPGALRLTYDLPQEGLVSLGLYDRAGRLLRWLLKSEYRRVGRNAEQWDGLDNFGRPLPAGHYELRGLYHPPLKLEYLMSATNPGNPPWPTLDGKGDWLSDESNPQAAATDGNWVYLGAPGSEKGWAIIAVDEQGQRQWGVHWEVYPRCISLAVSGDYLYALVSGPVLTDNSRTYTGGDNAVDRALLLCLDKRTGRYARFSAQVGALKIATWPYRHEQYKLWDLRREMNFRPATYAGQTRYFDSDVGETTNALGLAAWGDRIYVSMFYDDKLLVLDAATGEQTDEVPLPSPVGLQALPDGRLLAVSGNRVLSVDPTTKQARPLITDGLESPFGVTTGPGGEIYVSDWGRSFQVKVFSPEGKFLRAIGKPGGRPWVGKYDPEGMLVPRGLAVTDNGRLWVAEDDSSPRRVSIWDARTGRLLREYLGPAIYGGGGFQPNPEDPSRLLALGCEWKLDFTHRTYTPLATISRRLDRDQPYALTGSTGLSRLLGVPLLRRNGREYLVTDNPHHGLTLLMRRGDEFVPVAAVGVLSRPSYRNRDGTSNVVWDSDLGYHVLADWWPEVFRDKIGRNYTWCDRNGDGLTQPEEFLWRDTLSRSDLQDSAQVMEWYAGWGGAIGPDFSIYVGGFCRDRTAVYRLDVQGWTAAGAPQYDPQQAKLIVESPLVPGTIRGAVSGLYVSRAGDLFVSYDVPARQPGGPPPSELVGLACYTREGRLKWQLPGPADQGPKALWGNGFCGQVSLPGLGNVVGLWNWWHNFRAYLLTDDGLYVEALLDPDTRLGPEAAWSESYNVLWQGPDGRVYVMNGANDAHHLFLLRGLEQAGRFTAPVTLTQADVDRAAQFRQRPPTAEERRPIPWITQARAPIAVDGDLAEWNLNEGIALTSGQNRLARVALQYDRERLYLAYEVQDATPLLNKGEDWQRLFISGDCVDLMLATDPQADPHRRQPAPGDLRLLLGAFQDQPIAVLYRPTVPGTANPVRFMATLIDRVERLSDAQVQFRRFADHYTLEAAIPLRDLGLDRLPLSLRGDVGVIFSDQTGRDRVLRLYYYNRDTAMTADLSTEARLQPDQWGTFEIEAPEGVNLLRNPGFEEPLAQEGAAGWRLLDQRNTAEAMLWSEGAYGGKSCLLLRQTQAPAVPEDNTKMTWEEYVQSIKGGFILVNQVVPVTPGKQYAFRLRYRNTGGFFENRQPGPDRGYAAFQVWLFWEESLAGGKHIGHDWLMNERQDHQEWTLATNPRFGGAEDLWGKPFTAPEGAHACQVRLQLAVSSSRTPQVWVDNVELVELP